MRGVYGFSFKADLTKKGHFVHVEMCVKAVGLSNDYLVPVVILTLRIWLKGPMCKL